MRIIILIALIASVAQAQSEADSVTRGIIEKWREQPAVPLPSLDHHLGKITASISVFSVLSLSGMKHRDAALITTGAAFTFELIQVLFFDESLRHSTMDMVLFSYHYPVWAALERQPGATVFITINLTSLYLLLL